MTPQENRKVVESTFGSIPVALSKDGQVFVVANTLRALAAEKPDVNGLTPSQLAFFKDFYAVPRQAAGEVMSGFLDTWHNMSQKIIMHMRWIGLGADVVATTVLERCVNSNMVDLMLAEGVFYRLVNQLWGVPIPPNPRITGGRSNPYPQTTFSSASPVGVDVTPDDLANRKRLIWHYWSMVIRSEPGDPRDNSPRLTGLVYCLKWLDTAITWINDNDPANGGMLAWFVDLRGRIDAHFAPLVTLDANVRAITGR